MNRRGETVRLQANHSRVVCSRGLDNNKMIMILCVCGCGEVPIRNNNSMSSQEYAKCADWELCPGSAAYLISRSDDRCWCETAPSCTNTSLFVMRRPGHVLCPNFFLKGGVGRMFLNTPSLLLQKVEHAGRATELHKTGAEKSERRREYGGKLQK